MRDSTLDSTCVRFYYVYSFALLGGGLATVHANLDKLGLQVIPQPPGDFEQYLVLHNSVFAAEPMAHEAGESETPKRTRQGIRVTLELTPRPLDAILRRRFHVHMSGRCGYVLELDLNLSEVIANGDDLMATFIQAASAVENKVKISCSQSENRSATWKLPSDALLLSDVFRLDVDKLLKEYTKVSGGSGDRQLDVFDHEDVGQNSGRHPVVIEQIPFVATVVRFGKQEDYEAFIPKPALDGIADDSADEFVLRRFAALLYRWKTTPTKQWEDVDLRYIQQGTASGNKRWFLNGHVHRDIFVASTIRSCLVVANVSRDTGRDLEKFTVPGIERTLCAVRARWHVAVVLAALIQCDLDLLFSFPEVNILHVLARRKAQALRLLGSTYAQNLASETLTSLYRHLMDLFGVVDLENHATAKLRLLDSITRTAGQSQLEEEWSKFV